MSVFICIRGGLDPITLVVTGDALGDTCKCQVETCIELSTCDHIEVSVGSVITGQVICGQLLRKHLEIMNLLLLEDCVQFPPLQSFCFCHSSFSCLLRKRKALHLTSPVLDRGFVTHDVGEKLINVKILLFYILPLFCFFFNFSQYATQASRTFIRALHLSDILAG